MSGGLRSGSVVNFKRFFKCLAGCVLAARRAAGARARGVISAKEKTSAEASSGPRRTMSTAAHESMQIGSRTRSTRAGIVEARMQAPIGT